MKKEWRLKSAKNIWAGITDGIKDGMDTATPVIVDIMSKTFASLGSMILTALGDQIKTWPDKLWSLLPPWLGGGPQTDENGDPIDTEFGAGDVVAGAAVLTGAYVGQRTARGVWNGAKWVKNLGVSSAPANVSTLARQKLATEKGIHKAATKLGVRYGGAAAFGPFAPFAAAAITIGLAGYGAFDAIENRADLLNLKAGETATVMESMKVGVAGALSAMTANIITTDTMYKALNTEIITWGKEGKDAGLLNKSLGSWMSLLGGQDFTGNYDWWGKQKKFATNNGTGVTLPTEQLAGESQMSVDEARQVVADILSQIDVEGKTIQAYTDKLQLLREQAELFSKPAGATVALSMFNAAVLRMSNPDITQGMLSVKNDISGMMRAIAAPEFHRGTIALSTMTDTLGKLDDNVNDWSASELASFKSITESMGNFANQANSSNGANKEVLQEIREQLVELNRKSQIELNADLHNAKQVIKAIKANNEFAN
jgi:hypothetical protein